MSAALRSSSVVVDGVRSPVLEAGPEGEGEAIVFVHGNPGSAAEWGDHLLPLAGEHGRAIALDMPGYGHADRPKDFEYTVEGYARHLGGALDQLGVERAHLVLHDFGGPWGLRWGLDHPDRWASVTLINTGLLLGYRWHEFARIWRTPVLGELFLATTTRRGFHMVMKRINPKPLPDAFVDRMFDEGDKGRRRAVLKLYRAESDPAGKSAAWLPKIRALDLPALVVWGAKDRFLKVDLAHRQLEGFPRARIELLPESGHWCFADDPEGVAAKVIPFLAEQVGDGARAQA
jgi:pimeloyl-ACP methyl ester carboxylesterase